MGKLTGAERKLLNISCVRDTHSLQPIWLEIRWTASFAHPQENVTFIGVAMDRYRRGNGLNGDPIHHKCDRQIDQH